MSIFRITAYEKRKVVQIIAFVDIIQSLLYIAIRFCEIVFTSFQSLPGSEQKSYPFLTLLRAFVMVFYLVHMTLALKLLSALELEGNDIITSTRNAKVWQNWAIVYLIFIVGYSFSNILSAHSWMAVLYLGYGAMEIMWRLMGIYNIGVYIEDLLEKIQYDTPTIMFFSVRFPVPSGYQNDLNGDQ